MLVLNRQRALRAPLAAIRRFAERALPLCAEQSADGRFALLELEEVVVTLVSDRRIAALHKQFMDIPGPTDVITFQHGEIVLSVETAARCGAEFGHGTWAETGLYLVHGLLHLNGYLDGTVSQRRRMHAVQNKIWRACLPVE